MRRPLLRPAPKPPVRAVPRPARRLGRNPLLVAPYRQPRDGVAWLGAVIGIGGLLALVLLLLPDPEGRTLLTGLRFNPIDFRIEPTGMRSGTPLLRSFRTPEPGVDEQGEGDPAQSGQLATTVRPPMIADAPPDDSKEISRDEQSLSDPVGSLAGKVDVTAGRVGVGVGVAPAKYGFLRYVRWMDSIEHERSLVRKELLAPGSTILAGGGRPLDTEQLSARLDRLRRLSVSLKPPVPSDCLVLDGYYRDSLDREASIAAGLVSAAQRGDAAQLYTMRIRTTSESEPVERRTAMELERLCRRYKIRPGFNARPTERTILNPLMDRLRVGTVGGQLPGIGANLGGSSVVPLDR